MRKSIFFLLFPMALFCSSYTISDEDRGDLNGDGIVDVADVTALIYYVLHHEWPSTDPVEDDVETYEVNGVSFSMVRIEPGGFAMGADVEDSDAYAQEIPPHEVTISRAYYMGRTEVTRELWLAVMGYTPDGQPGNLKRPITQITWSECQTFISRLNEMTGKTFRLPTEAEWEFAARGGNKTMGYRYSGSNDVDEVAWYSINSSDVGQDNPDFGAHPVATKLPNELGLYDMSGNAFEWCQDFYGAYQAEAQTDPLGPATGTRHIYRGGGWGYNAVHCRVTYRNSLPTASSIFCLGMRLAM